MNSSTELFRRAIVLPLTPDALSQIRLDKIESVAAYRIVDFGEDDDQFYRVWKTQLFIRINSKCGTLIDDYEEEEVRMGIEFIPQLIDEVLNTAILAPADHDLLLQFRSLAVEAVRMRSSLFFIF